MNSNTVEFWNILDEIVENHKIVIDRPKNTSHPKFLDYIYPLDYGYLDGTVSADGEGIDIWVGTSKERRVSGIISTVDYIKNDSEIKVLYACTQEEIQLIYRQHNRTKEMKGILNIR